MWWLVGRDCIVGDGCKFEFDASFDEQPVKLTKEVCRGAVWMEPEDNAGNRILDSLQLSQVGFRDAVEIEFNLSSLYFSKIQFNTLQAIPKLTSLYINLLCGIESNAFRKLL
jgi:hypothetical protein